MAAGRSTAAPTGTDTRRDERRWLTLAVVVSASFMAIFDQFVVNVAVPAMQQDLRASFAQIQFVIAGYALAYAVTLITGGRLGDIYGRKRLFLVGMAIFTVASAFCGLAPDAGVLVGARLIQGLGAALMGPQVLAIIQVAFPPAERAGALSVYGAVVGISSLAGQALGGLLIRADLFGLGWRIVFLVNIPIGAVALLAAALLVRETRSPNARALDLGGVAIVTGGLFLLTFPLVAGRDAGWPAWAWACLLAAGPTLFGFIAFERWQTARGATPLVALELFRVRSFSVGLVVAFLFGAANPAMFFTLALYLQIGLGYSPLAAGLLFAPAPVGYFICATLSGRLVRRFGRRLLLVGLLMKAAAWTGIGIVAFRADLALPIALLVPLMFAEGAGAGFTSTPLIGLSLAEIEGRDAGAAAGVFTTAQQVAGAMGVALIGVVFFGALAAGATSIGADLAPPLRDRLATTLPAADVMPTVDAFRACVTARGAESDPAVVPAICTTPALQPAAPDAAAALAEAGRRATALGYARAYILALACTVGALLFAALATLAFPTAPRPIATAPPVPVGE